jgi:hypothetical protein
MAMRLPLASRATFSIACSISATSRGMDNAICTPNRGAACLIASADLGLGRHEPRDVTPRVRQADGQS